MKLKWEKYWYDLGTSVIKHVGTALAGWGGINIANASGVAVPTLDWKALGIFILAAGIIPAIASFWQRQPLPDIEETTITVTTTKSPEPQNETKPTPPAIDHPISG